jgi:hypothetical protein
MHDADCVSTTLMDRLTGGGRKGRLKVKKKMRQGVH